MQGGRRTGGIREKLAKMRVKAAPWTSIKMLIRNSPSMMLYTQVPSLENRDRPGVMPCMVSAPSSTATEASPGMPNVSRGMRVAAVVALLAASGAITPSMHPWPNSSGCLERRLASL